MSSRHDLAGALAASKGAAACPRDSTMASTERSRDAASAQGTIRPIDKASVHRIHSGQVVLELQGAVKELVENSLDAGASVIEVRMKEHGLDSIEVVDNGSGIREADWPNIGRKHHTSKLSTLSDLASVSTFGFRGEALSALCALCESVTVSTATAETAPMATVLKMGKSGEVEDQSGKVARARGTTVLLAGLFSPLPVRRKEFTKTIKREFTKALGLLTAYALVPASTPLPSSTSPNQGVKLRVELVAKTGKRTMQLATDGRVGLRSAIGSIWGPKGLEGIMDVDLELDVEVDKVMARREGLAITSQKVRVKGVISIPVPGQGRSSPDRQFYYINSRPGNLPKIAKVVNEVYKSFNTSQSPLAILDFILPPDSVDINVSPDKRTIYMHSEANLLDALRSGLENLFQPSRQSFSLNGATQVPSSRSVPTRTIVDTVEEADVSTPALPYSSAARRSRQTTPSRPSPPPLRRNMSSLDSEDLDRPGPSRNRVRMHVVEPAPTSSDNDEEMANEDAVPETQESNSSLSANLSRPGPRRPRKQPSPPIVFTAGATPSPRAAAAVAPVPKLKQTVLDLTRFPKSPSRPVAITNQPAPSRSGKDARQSLRDRLQGFAKGDVRRDDDDEDGADVGDDDDVIEPQGEEDPAVNQGSLTWDEEDKSLDEADEVTQEQSTRLSPEGVDIDMEGEDTQQTEDGPVGSSSTTNGEGSFTVPITVDDDDAGDDPAGLTHFNEASPLVDAVDRPSAYRKEITSVNEIGEVTHRFDLARLEGRLKEAKRRREQKVDLQEKRPRLEEHASAAGIKTRDAAAAEQALSRTINKSDFADMEVLGQFNRGFIIARLRRETSDDLYIIDQHASDEKYNFETLQETTVIKAQTLIRPKPLQLTAGDELVAMENLDVLRSNGFNVAVDEDLPPGRGERIKLLAMPVSKETVFDFKDLEQLLHLLSDGTRPAGQMVRCQKARAMFAMRACRKSVMIGRALTKSQMGQLLRNMGTIDQPWNCPHGRPTMRHLTSLNERNATPRIDWNLYEE